MVAAEVPANWSDGVFSISQSMCRRRTVPGITLQSRFLLLDLNGRQLEARRLRFRTRRERD